MYMYILRRTKERPETMCKEVFLTGDNDKEKENAKHYVEQVNERGDAKFKSKIHL